MTTTKKTKTTLVDAEARRRFAEDGVVCLRQAISDDAVTLLAAGIDRNLADPGHFDYLHFERPGNRYEGKPGQFYSAFCLWDSTPEFHDVLWGPEVAPTMAELFGANRLRLLYDQLFVKEAGGGRRTPWHQDLSYLCVDGRQGASMWIPLDPVARDDALEFVRGSHLGPLYQPSSFDPADATRPPGEDDSLLALPDIEADRPAHEILSWAMEPGDVLVFNFAILHGGAGTSANRRRTYSVRMVGDDIVFAPRRFMSPSFPGVGEVLRPGDPLRHPYFPVLLDRSAA